MLTRLLFFLFISATFLARAAAADLPRPQVVATNVILADLVRQVGGDRIDVHSLVPAGADLHSFDPAPADIRALQHANLVVMNGLGLEGWIDKAVRNSGFSGKIIEASKGVAPLPAEDHADHDHDHGAELADPHAWLDVSRTIQYIQNIRTALAEIDPAGANDYAAWAELYIAQLRVLDSWIKRQVAQIPAERRILVMDHDAFRYFAKAYSFETRALSGVSRLDEPSAQEFAALSQAIRTEGVPVIFMESAANQKLLEQLASESNTSLGGRLYVENFSPAGDQSYMAMMKSNVRTIARGVSGQKE